MRLSRLILYTDEEVFDALLKKHNVEHPGVIETGYDSSWLQKTIEIQDKWDLIITGGAI